MRHTRPTDATQALKIVSLTFTLIGAAFLLTALIIAIVYGQFTATAVPVEATIVDFERSNRGGMPIVSYDYEGQTYQGTLNHYSSRMRVGDTAQIHVNPDNPQQFRGVEGRILTIVFASVGGAMLIAAYVLFLLYGKRRREGKNGYGGEAS